jgi:hypothetical protein
MSMPDIVRSGHETLLAEPRSPLTSNGRFAVFSNRGATS